MYDTIEEYFKHFLELPKNEGKNNWEKVFNDMAVHTRKRLPKELLLARRPNEDQKIFDYRILNYEAITYGSMNKAMDDLYRIISGISYTITVPDNVSQYLNNFIIPQYSSAVKNEVISVKTFIEKIALRRDIEDPNGFLIWFPSGEGLIDSSQKVTPIPQLVLSSQYYYCDENVFIYISDEKSPLENTAGQKELKGDIYYFITRTEIYKVYNVGTVADPKWIQELIYKHNLGTFPVIILGGDINAEGFYESYFAPYLAFGNEAIRQYSDWQGVMTISTFPHKEIFATECMVRKIVKNSNEPSTSEETYSNEVELIPYKTSPYGVTIRPVPLKNDALNEQLEASIPSVRFISPPVDVVKYSGEVWQLLIDKAEQALNIDMTVGIDQSGVAKQIDKESQYSMISKIGNNFFDNIYLNSLKIIDGYFNRITIEQSTCSINKPSSFYVKTEQELVGEISQLKTNNAPGFFLQEATLDLAKKRFNGSPVKQKIFDFIATYDPYYTLTTQERNNLLASGVMTKEDFIRSMRMFTILNQIVSEQSAGKFLEMDLQKINEAFEEKVKAFFPEAAAPQFDANGNPIID